MQRSACESPAFREVIPGECGVYLLYSASRQLLYVGKAINLRRRVLQHLGNHGSGDSVRVRTMHHAIDAVSWVCAPTELHALLLEDALIKQLSPIYNKRQNKFRSHVWLRLDDSPGSGLRLLAHPPTEGTRREVFGPFKDRYFAETVAEIARNYYGARTTLRYSGRGRLGSRGVSGNTFVHTDRFGSTAERAEAFREFLTGDEPGLLQVLEAEMKRFTGQHAFEAAARARDTLQFCRSYFESRLFFRRFSAGVLTAEAEDGASFVFEDGSLVRFGGESSSEWSQWLTIDNPALSRESVMLDRSLLVSSWLHSGGRRWTFTDR